MSKKFFIPLMLVATLFMTGCNKDKDNDNKSLEDMDEFLNYPYSELTSDQQKVKLEQESIDLLNELQAANSLKMIDAFEYFFDLLDWDTPDIDDPWQEGNSQNAEQWIFDVTNLYGVFTWNSSRKEWTQSNSTSELKFVFPSSSKSQSNNASLSLKGTNSSANITWKWEDYWDEYEDIYKLPGSVSGILTVDNKETAKIEASAEYQKMDKIEIDEDETIEGSSPVKTNFKITTEEGYTYQYEIDGKGKSTKLETQLSRDNKILIEALYQMDIDIKSLIDDASEDVDNIFDLDSDVKANGYMKLMDNLMLVYAIDAANLAEEIDRIDSRYYSYTKQYNDEMEKALAQYMKVSLVSTKDGYKIADLIPKSERDDYGDYFLNLYLRFNDNTLVEAEAYFSSGFGKLESKWEDFVDAFR